MSFTLPFLLLLAFSGVLVKSQSDQPPQNVAIVHSAASYEQCLRMVYLGVGAWIELAQCSITDPNQWILTTTLTTLDGFVEIQFYSKNEPSISLAISNWLTTDGYPLNTQISGGGANMQWKVNDGSINGVVQLQLQYSGKCLTSYEGETYLVQSTCLDMDTNPSQAWIIEPISNLIRPIQSVGSQYPSTCLGYKSTSTNDIQLVYCNTDSISVLANILPQSGSSTATNVIQLVGSNQCIQANLVSQAVTQEVCSYTSPQFWTQVTNSDGTFTLQNDGNCLSASDDGLSALMQPCDASQPQIWKQSTFPLPPTLQPQEIILHLENVQTTYCLHPSGMSTSDGAEVQLTNCDIRDATQPILPIDWGTNTLAPGYVQLNNKCLSLSTSSSGSDVHIVQQECIGEVYQQWNIIYNGEDTTTFQLKNAFSGLCATADQGFDHLYQYDCNDPVKRGSQIWTVNQQPYSPFFGKK